MIEIIDLNRKEYWDEIVRSFEEYDVYYLSGYVKSFKLHGDGEPILFYYNNAGMKGFTVMMKRDISEDIRFSSFLQPGEYFDIVSPYGYGGFIFEGEIDDENVRKCYTAYLDCLRE